MDSKTKTLDLVYTAMGVTLICVCSWINIPMTVPFTLQTFAIPAVLLILGGKRGTIATIVYVLMGAIGIPVFAGFSGGLAILLGNTGGYIIGFIFMALIYTAAVKIFGEKKGVKIISLIAGLIVCYAFGTAWFMYIYLKDTGEVGLFSVLTWCVLPYIVPDLVKIFLAILISDRVKRFIR
ncbi:MAG: biotin transporter BioY [Lachnospiraceae bacterium]|nr:biotin transporter BioY [Lachnospiraceae bacterium]